MTVEQREVCFLVNGLTRGQGLYTAVWHWEDLELFNLKDVMLSDTSNTPAIRDDNNVVAYKLALIRMTPD